jgi:hypothetical protein
MEGIVGPREIDSVPIDFKRMGPMIPSPDGKTVYLGREADDGKLSAICAIDLRSGKTTVVYETFGMAVVAGAISPDGRSLAFREAAPGDEGGVLSLLGIIDLRSPSKPVYQAINEEQWSRFLQAYLDVGMEIKPEELKSAERQMLPAFLVRVENLIEAFRRDFPKSPLVDARARDLENLRETLKRKGLPVSEDSVGPQW